MPTERSSAYIVRSRSLTTFWFLQEKKDASDLLQQKADLEKEKKQVEDEAVEKEKLRDRKVKLIGNYVHESVPLNDNEVSGKSHVIFEREEREEY